MGKVEEVARAIYDKLEGPVNNQDFKRQAAQWDLSKVLARAAIEAMKVPTREMLDAGCDVGPDTNQGCFSDNDAETVFNAMIDAALSEDKEQG